MIFASGRLTVFYKYGSRLVFALQVLYIIINFKDTLDLFLCKTLINIVSLLHLFEINQTATNIMLELES